MLQFDAFQAQYSGSQILDAGSRILDPGCGIKDPGYETLDPESWILVPRSRILNAGFWILHPGSRGAGYGSRVLLLDPVHTFGLGRVGACRSTAFWCQGGGGRMSLGNGYQKTHTRSSLGWQLLVGVLLQQNVLMIRPSLYLHRTLLNGMLTMHSELASCYQQRQVIVIVCLLDFRQAHTCPPHAWLMGACFI